MSKDKLTEDCLDSYLCDAFAELRPSLTVHHGECIVEMEQAYTQLKEIVGWFFDEKIQRLVRDSEDTIKPTVNPDHALAKLIDTLGWKLSHFPHAREGFTDVRISRKEYQEIKDFVEVVEK